MLWWGGQWFGIIWYKCNCEALWMCGPHQVKSVFASLVKRGCQISPPSREILLHLENNCRLQSSTWNYKPRKTGREGFPVLQAGRNAREIQLKAQPTKVRTFGAHSAPGQPQHSQVLGKKLSHSSLLEADLAWEASDATEQVKPWNFWASLA